MSRGLATAFKNELGSRVLYPAFFVEFQFDSGTTRFWTGEVDISADLGDGSVTWTGGGLIGAMSFSGEGESLSARNLTFTLNGVDQSYYAVAVNTAYRTRPVKVWFALLNSAGTSVAYSYLLEEARMDTLGINEEDQTITLTLTCESRLVDMFRPHRSFLNNADLHKEYPEDDFYEYVPRLPGMRLPWGLKVTQSTYGTGGSPPSGGPNNGVGNWWDIGVGGPGPIQVEPMPPDYPENTPD